MISSVGWGTEMASTIDTRWTEDISMSRVSDGRRGTACGIWGVLGRDEIADAEEGETASASFSSRAPPMSAKEKAPKEVSPAKDFFMSLVCDMDMDMSVKDSSESRFCTLRFSNTGIEPSLVEPNLDLKSTSVK